MGTSFVILEPGGWRDMDLQTLIHNLKHGDSARRIETLQIIAMVEETEALPALSWICKHDRDPRVRQTAQWAGKLVWQAHQRGHSTQRAIQALYEACVSAEQEEIFLDGVATELVAGKTGEETRFLREQARLKREMLEILHDRSERGQALSLSDLAREVLDDDPGHEGS